jgi:hypothetical protein
MKILQKATMPNGTKIQLEDWNEHGTEQRLTIGAYPIAKNTGKYRWIEGGKIFRLSISQNEYAGYTNDAVKADFEALQNGEKKLEDLSKHFWNLEKDMWYLGMNVEYKGY